MKPTVIMTMTKAVGQAMIGIAAMIEHAVRGCEAKPAVDPVEHPERGEDRQQAERRNGQQHQRIEEGLEGLARLRRGVAGAGSPARSTIPTLRAGEPSQTSHAPICVPAATAVRSFSSAPSPMTHAALDRAGRADIGVRVRSRVRRR
jgi:hypothetical protein